MSSGSLSFKGAADGASVLYSYSILTKTCHSHLNKTSRNCVNLGKSGIICRLLDLLTLLVIIFFISYQQPSFDDSKALDILSGDFVSEVPVTPAAPQCQAPAAKASSSQKVLTLNTNLHLTD